MKKDTVVNLKDDKKHKRRHILRELKKVLINFYDSAKTIHVTIYDNLSSYISSSFGYAPGRGNFPRNENLLWK